MKQTLFKFEIFQKKINKNSIQYCYCTSALIRNFASVILITVVSSIKYYSPRNKNMSNLFFSN